MTDQGAWQKANEEYLAVALEWLRLRLEPQTNTHATANARHTEDMHAARRGFLKWRPPAADPSVALLPPANITEELIAQAAAAMDRAAGACDPPPALITLAQRFGLSP